VLDLSMPGSSGLDMLRRVRLRWPALRVLVFSMHDSPAMVAHLASRHVATMTVDVVSNDSFIGDPVRLARETLAKVDANRGGIILFHDIKASTAKALPEILKALASRGYSVVHLVPKQPMEPKPDLVATFEPQVAKLMADKSKSKQALVPFFGTTGPEPRAAAKGDEPSETAEAPTPPSAETHAPTKVAVHARARSKRHSVSETPADIGTAWSTSVRRTPAD